MVIPKLENIFGMFGIPLLKSGYGPPFNGHEFTKFARQFGFKHRKATPLWPEANGEAERFVRTFRKLLHTPSSWKRNMNYFL